MDKIQGESSGLNTKQIILWLGLGSFIFLVVLVIMETYSYYFAGVGGAKTGILAKSSDKHLPNAQKEGFDVLDVKDEVKQFPDIIDYIEKVEEPQFYNRSNNIGCYDNNDLIGRTHAGETCKSWFPKVTDIFFKPRTPAETPSKTQNTQNLNNYFNVDGMPYSFAELCPETTGQKDPIVCLHNRANDFELMSTKLANINDSIQTKQDQKISNLSNDASYHIIDGNRIYNQSQVLDFLGYERSLGLGSAIHGGTPGDQLDDLGLYTRKQRVNYLAGTKNTKSGSSTNK